LRAWLIASEHDVWSGPNGTSSGFSTPYAVQSLAACSAYLRL